MRKHSSFLAIVVFSNALVLINTLFAQTEVNIPARKDNTLYENAAGAFSNGMGHYLFVAQNNHGEVRRTLVAFDVAGHIPTGATILSAKLTLNMSKAFSTAGAQNVLLHRVLADWGEGASDAGGEEGAGINALPGDATWIHTFFNASRWANPGGDFAPTASASQSVSAVGFYTWGSTPEMAADVQTWLDLPANNFGWLLLSNEIMNGSAKRFDALQNSVASNRPVLHVIYTATSSIHTESATPPMKFALAQNHPNPFSRDATMRTNIRYDLPKPSHVKLAIYDLLGKQVRTLVEAKKASGIHTIVWNGEDDRGAHVARGIYFYRLEAEGYIAMRKLSLIR